MGKEEGGREENSAPHTWCNCLTPCLLLTFLCWWEYCLPPTPHMPACLITRKERKEEGGTPVIHYIWKVMPVSRCYTLPLVVIVFLLEGGSFFFSPPQDLHCLEEDGRCSHMEEVASWCWWRYLYLPPHLPVVTHLPILPLSVCSPAPYLHCSFHLRRKELFCRLQLSTTYIHAYSAYMSQMLDTCTSLLPLFLTGGTPVRCLGRFLLEEEYTTLPTLHTHSTTTTCLCNLQATFGEFHWSVPTTPLHATCNSYHTYPLLLLCLPYNFLSLEWVFLLTAIVLIILPCR